MRLIDADALIEKCGDWYVEEGTESGFIGTLKNLLATQPTIQPESHWIPVTEATPTEDDEYWCTFGAETGWFVDWCDWYQGRWVVWTDNTVSEVRYVIAWCKPLEPYKKGVTE